MTSPRCENCDTEMEFNYQKACYECPGCGNSTESISEVKDPKYIR